MTKDQFVEQFGQLYIKLIKRGLDTSPIQSITSGKVYMCSEHLIKYISDGTFNIEQTFITFTIYGKDYKVTPVENCSKAVMKKVLIDIQETLNLLGCRKKTILKELI